MTRMNCWEFQDCGRELGGKKTNELGACPASEESKLNGINDGKNAGRACWALAGTHCSGEIQGTYAQKLGTCLNCDFFTFVREQQKDHFVASKHILKML